MAKGGGSWKVAYADFVTAMMAFFMVMWIGAQDQKVKQAVANYFVDPSGISKAPAKTGAVSSSSEYGNVPSQQSAQMSRGRDTYTHSETFSAETKMVSDWIFNDDKLFKKWQETAQIYRDQAKQSQEVQQNQKSVLEYASPRLVTQLKSEFSRGIAGASEGLYRDLLIKSMENVNWTQVAEDLIMDRSKK